MRLFKKKKKRCRVCKQNRHIKFYHVDNKNKDKRSNICKTCKYEAKQFLRQLKRERILAHMGGKCEICGYDKHKVSLQCHHTNPKEKDSNYKNILDWKWEKIVEELKKCELVCANCHIEIHSK